MLYNNLYLNHHPITFATGKFPWYFECPTQQFNIFPLTQFSLVGTIIHMGALKESYKLLFIRKNVIIYFSICRRQKINFDEIYLYRMIFNNLKAYRWYSLGLYALKIGYFQSILIPYSKIQLVKYSSSCQWHCIHFEAVF